MSLSFNGKGIESLHFNGKLASQIFFGAKLVWQKALLIMGNEKYICIEYIPSKNLISSSQNPITISVFMNTNTYTTTTPPMYILDSAGVTCGYSNTGVVGAQETIDGCTGYKRTNTFRDNQLYLIEGKTYYIIYKIDQWDSGDNYFAYYEDNTSAGHYKTWNPNGGHTSVHDLTDKTDIGDLTSFVDVIEASNNELFIWQGPSKSGLTNGYEYYRNNDSLSNYVPELNYGSTDKYEVLNHILFMDKGSSQYGSPGDKFVITETYTDGPIGVISRTSNYTNHVWIPPVASHFNRNADAYKYIFDSNVHLSDNDSQGKALVWGNDYVYTNGSCYSRGSQYLGYSCYEARTNGQYINSPSDLANVNANELFYVDDNVKDSLNTSKGLKIRGNTTFDTACTVADGNDFYAAFRTVAAATDSGKALTTVTNNSTYQWYNAIYEKKSGWQNKIGSSPITTEPSNPTTGDVYWKDTTTTGWATDQWGNKITDNCLVKYGGQYWIKIETHQEQDYFTTTAASSLFSNADTNGILVEFQPSQLYQEENISTLVTRVEGDTGLVNAELKTGKRHYLEVTEVNGV